MSAGLSLKGAEKIKDEELRIVDFVLANLMAEEEVILGEGVSLKKSYKPKLEKVSPSAWIVASGRILRRLMLDPKFDTRAYLDYQEMVGELGCRFSWQSMLIFDDEYRKRQAQVVLRDGASEKPGGRGASGDNTAGRGTLGATRGG